MTQQKSAKISLVKPNTLKLQELASIDDKDICPKCFGTGMEVIKGKGARVCVCQSKNIQDKLMKKLRVPKRYFDCDMSTYKARNPSQQNAVMESVLLLAAYKDSKEAKGLLFMGPVGVGKTHLAISIIKGMAENNIPSLFYEFGALLKEIQDSYNPNTKSSELKILANIFNIDVLVLDEIGASKPSDWVKDTMAHIINTRYNDKKLTIFTTNYLDKRKSQIDETFEERIGVRLRSRLFEMCQTINIEGDDYRKKFDSPLQKNK
jgi:DNA replication protein DnaC